MLREHFISVVIPALNEADSLPALLPAIPDYVDEVIVVDNGSTDGSGDIARHLGAKVVVEPIQGYGQACLAGIANLNEASSIVVFLDADFCDDPSYIEKLCQPIVDGSEDFVLSSRMHKQARRYLTVPQRFGNQLASFLMNLIWRSDYTDLGPFRAISRTSLQTINMRDRDFGWTVEMQINAQLAGLRISEIFLPYKHRAFGQSKVSGTVKGVVFAGTKILYVIGRSFLRHKLQPLFKNQQPKQSVDKAPRSGAHFRPR